MSAGSVLAAYRYPEVESSLRTEFTPGRLLASAGDTLYLVSAERHQRLLAPLLVGAGDRRGDALISFSAT